MSGSILGSLDSTRLTRSTTDVAATTDQNSELHVFYYVGAAITLAASLFVIFSYLKFRACRQHPSSLIFWRSVSDVIFSLHFIILFSDEDSKNHCNIFSFLFQFSVLSSQSWYFMNAVDLLRSMRNPFTDPKANIPMYHVFVWSMSLITSIAIDVSKRDHYRPDMQLCWTSVQSNGIINYVNWLTFFIPTLCYYFFSIGTMVYAGLRLKKGLQETFATRQIVLFNGIRYVAGFCAYWTFAGIIYGIITLRSQNGESSEHGPSTNNNLPLYATFAVTIAFRGIVDAIIWAYNQKVLQVYRKWWNGEPHDDPADIGMNDADINRALRREVLIFSTTGIALAIDRANSVPFSAVLPSSEQYPSSLDPSEPRNMHSVVKIDVHREDFSQQMEFFLSRESAAVTHASSSHARATGADSDSVNGEPPPIHHHTSILQEARSRAVTVGPDGVPFLDYAPQVFRYLRFQFGIDEGEYARSIQGKTEAMIEKFTEGGRSGSFFYFSENGNFIVKTLTVTESSFLIRWLPKYVEFMSKNRNSLISRFCGFHSIRLYNLTIYFMVMQSVFLTKRKIHERYDLKGSFIDRHASAAGGQKKVKSSGKHGHGNGLRSGGFRNIVYKDNDLNRTVRLSEKDRVAFLHQVRKDAYFLRDSGIMDYSLLLGVHHTSHVVPLMSPRHSEAMGTSEHATDPTSPTGRAGHIQLTPLGTPSPIANATGAGAGAGATTLPSYPTSLGSAISSPTRHNSAASASSSASPIVSLPLFTKDDGGVQASIIQGPGIYFFGLIDVLQEYNTSKKLERFAKIYFRCKDGDGISSMPPNEYAERFVKFMSDMTKDDDDVAQVPIGAPLPTTTSSFQVTTPGCGTLISPSSSFSTMNQHHATNGHLPTSPRSAPPPTSHHMNMYDHDDMNASLHTGVDSSHYESSHAQADALTHADASSSSVTVGALATSSAGLMPVTDSSTNMENGVTLSAASVFPPPSPSRAHRVTPSHSITLTALSPSHVFAVHPSSDPSAAAPIRTTSPSQSALVPMGITDSAHETRSALASTSGWASI